MRIVGGQWRGRALARVGKGDDANRLRPTSDRVRESLFNVLEHGPLGSFAGTRVLDLFAGTGALGFEALSRGAVHATFWENGRVGQRLIRQNMDLLGCTETCDLITRDATKPGQNPSTPYDLCFMDPPYRKGFAEAALTSLALGKWLLPDALIVLEEGTEITLPPPFELIDLRTYGDTIVHIGRLRDKD